MSTNSTTSSNPCPQCGANNWDDGYLKAGATLHYKSSGTSWFAKEFSKGSKITARACLNCGYLDLRIPID